MHPMRIGTIILATGLLSGPLPAVAQDTPVSLRDSFPIGSGDGILNQIQARSIESKAKAGGSINKDRQYPRDALELLSLQYPESRPVNDAKPRLAALLLRNGQEAGKAAVK